MKIEINESIPPVKRPKRSDGLFTRIPTSLVVSIRQAKVDGYSLKEISQRFKVARSTVSIYCRDLYDHPNRVYLTEEEYRMAVNERARGVPHNKYHSCLDCGGRIRADSIRCLKCNQIYQSESGILNNFIKAGEANYFKGDYDVSSLEVIDIIIEG